MLIDKIKEANVQAMKDRDSVAKGIIGIVMNKYMVQEIEKRTTSEKMTDADLVAIIQKTIKELAEEAENYNKVGKTDARDNAKRQSEVIAAFLPAMMSEDEIKRIILAQNDKSIGNVMKLFKTEYAGKCDMRVVQEVLKKI